MSILWADFPSGSQGLYGDDESAMLDGVWAENVNSGCFLSDDPDPVIGSSGRALNSFSGSSGCYMRIVLPSTYTTAGSACRLWMTSLPSDLNLCPRIATFATAANAAIATVFVDTAGKIVVKTGNSAASGTLLGESDGPCVTAGAWWHIEVKLSISATVGTVEVRVNGVTKVTATGLDTGSTAIGQFYIGSVTGGQGFGSAYFYKDLVIWDTSGTYNNDFLGSVTVFFRKVLADISLGEWTTSSGTDGAALIGHAGPPVDTDYIAADSAPPAAAEFTLEDLPADISSVRAVIPVVRAAKVDGGDGNIQLGLSPEGTNYDTGPDTPITSAFTYWPNSTTPFVSEEDPTSAAAWTVSGFNGARMKIDRTL